MIIFYSLTLVMAGLSCRVNIWFPSTFQTNKERNMWSCRYHARRPVEIIMAVRNPKPGEKFSLSQMKIWNYNKSIAVSMPGVP